VSTSSSELFPIDVTPFRQEYLGEAAALFVQAYRKQRSKTPLLPELMEDTARVEAMLAGLMESCPGVAALDRSRLVGYMGWFLVERFRGTERKGAYCPEWGHALVAEAGEEIYRAMYRRAAAQWSAAGCQVHAITLLAQDRAAERAWFWNGFGLTVVDAVRPVRPLGIASPSALDVRQATQEDVDALAALDAEHWQHYVRSPIFMVPHPATDAAGQAEFLARPKNSVWLALEGDVPAGFMRFEGYDFDGVAIVESERTISITGAYVRPAFRGRKVATYLLDAALRDYSTRGFTCCAVNFESFNPEAVSFWPKHFEPVCLSVVRVPETSET